MLNKVPQRILMVLLVAFLYVGIRVGLSWARHHRDTEKPVVSSVQADAISALPAAVEVDSVGAVMGYILLDTGELDLWLLPNWAERCFMLAIPVSKLDRSEEISRGYWIINGDRWEVPLKRRHVDEPSRPPVVVKSQRNTETVAKPSEPSTLAKCLSLGKVKRDE